MSRVTIAEAPGKVILLGEHAVVYGRPAIAAPVSQLRARAWVEEAPAGFELVAADVGLTYSWGEPAPEALRPLVALLKATWERLGLGQPPAVRLTLRSQIPIARGLGSGAALATALVRGMAEYAGVPLPPEEISHLVYEAERFYHGNPSGIDNTVVAYEQPVYFVRGQRPRPVRVGAPFELAIADTGVPSSTREVVDEVRLAWERERERYERLFDQIGALVERGRRAMESGDLPELGRIMDANHERLVELGVSLPALEGLIRAARGAGALGAKLSGAGRGGNAIALLAPDSRQAVGAALESAGAARLILTPVGRSERE